jgi:ABC-type antimicrobial peptide transport system permease subunit
LVVVAMALACGLGLLGGLFPAIHAARSNVADALHQQ